MTKITSPIIVALDYDDARSAHIMLDALDPQLCRVKIGKALFTRVGPTLVQSAMARGFEVFLDLKFHDIPNTVAAAIKSCADLGVWMCNIHISGGMKMMQAAVDALREYGDQKPLLIGVTVLTSLTQSELFELGFRFGPEELATLFAEQAMLAGLDGVVCSPLEAPKLRALSPDLLLVTPGIRLPGASKDDQSRVQTPEQAILMGSNYLVIGRPITQAVKPIEALTSILSTLPVLDYPSQ